MSLLKDIKAFNADLKTLSARISGLTLEVQKQTAFWQDEGNDLAVSAKRVGLAMDRMKEWLSK